MTISIDLRNAVRLSGRITTSNVTGEESLEIIPLWDKNETIEKPLDIGADAPPVRIEVYDFEHDGETWVFLEAGVWRRGTGNYAWTEYATYTAGTGYVPLDLTASTGAGGAAAREKSKQIVIKIKPIVDGPDKS